mgnify:CR=1 FL=1
MTQLKQEVPHVVQSQAFGLIITALFLFISIYQLYHCILLNIYNFYTAPRVFMLHTIVISYFFSLCGIIYFFVKILSEPAHLAGNPPIKRFWPVLVHFLANFSRIIYHFVVFAPNTKAADIFITFVEYGLYSVGIFLIYNQNDLKRSGFLCLKPFVLKPVQDERLIYI